MKWFHNIVQYLINIYIKKVLGWKEKPIIMPYNVFESYHKISQDYPKLLVDLAFASSKLKELGYDEETGDVYNNKYEQEFDLLDDSGNVVELDLKKLSKEDMN